jgi:hypothetical protein
MTDLINRLRKYSRYDTAVHEAADELMRQSTVLLAQEAEIKRLRAALALIANQRVAFSAQDAMSIARAALAK